jgi:hypothetical protein
VAIYSRIPPDEVRTSLGWAPFDDEGRYIEARFGKLSVVSLYLPSGSSAEHRQDFKFEVMAWFRPILDGWLRSDRDYVLCGDWNIVRSELDIRNWKSNQKTSGCLPVEREWMNALCADPNRECRLGGRLSRAASARAGIHLVEQPRRGPRQGRWLAHRLPVGHAIVAQPPHGLLNRESAAIFRPRAIFR